jgi:predicted heme/steroid binding protein
MTFKKQIWLLFFIFSLTFTLVACQEDVKEVPEEQLIELTLEELSVFDGTNGKKAYIAVDGFIYDVTNDPNWRNGMHNGFRAGNDLSIAINSSPHGKSFLTRVPKIGKLVEAKLKDMLTVISSVSGYESLVSLIYSGEVDIDFDSFEEITIFLPSLDAIALENMFNLSEDFDPSQGFDGLLEDLDIFDLLRYHMVEKTLLLNALKTGSNSIETLSGDFISVRVDGNDVFINDIKIKTSDLIASNGVVHVLDGVLVPPSFEIVVPPVVDVSVTVRFEGINGKLIEIKTFLVGDTLVFPNAPSEGGYTFNSWDTSAVTVSENITVKATYDKIFMTLSELAQFDGRNGNNAYVLVDGIIYDVTNNPNWPNGNHNGYQAGRDLSAAIRQSPHGLPYIQRQPIVAFIQPSS